MALIELYGYGNYHYRFCYDNGTYTEKTCGEGEIVYIDIVNDIWMCDIDDGRCPGAFQVGCEPDPTITYPHPETTTPSAQDCGTLCLGADDGVIKGGCCAPDFCLCTTANNYHVECPPGTLFCPVMEDCVRDDTCSSHLDTCCP